MILNCVILTILFHNAKSQEGFSGDTNSQPHLTFDKSLRPHIDVLNTYNYICNLREHCLTCPRCSNDKNCEFNGNCCLDKALQTADFSGMKPAINLQTSCRSISPYMCRDKLSVSGVTSFKHRVIMVDKCPLEYTDTVMKEKCESGANRADMTSSFPVFSTETKMVYTNIYCSQCNGVSPDTISYWKPTIRCTDITKVSQMKSKTDIWKLVTDTGICCVSDSKIDGGKDVETMECSWTDVVVDRCNMTGMWDVYDGYVEHMCGAFRSLVVYHGSEGHMTFKNIYCAACNYKIPLQETCETDGVRRGTFSFAALIDFNPKSALHEVEREKVVKQCEATEVLDPLTETCITIQCDPRFHYNPSTRSCDFLFASAQGLGYKLILYLEPNPSPYITVIQELNSWLTTILETQMYTFAEYYMEPLEIVQQISDFDYDVTTQTQAKVTGVYISAQIRVVTDMDVRKFQRVMMEKYSRPFRRSHMDSSVFEIQGISDCDSERFETAVKYAPSMLYHKEFLQHTIQTCQDCDMTTDYINIMDIVDCPYVVYEISNISLEKLDNVVNITIGEHFIDNVNISQYTICGDMIKICLSALDHAYLNTTNDSKINTTTDDNSKIPPDNIATDWWLTIVTIIATTLSLLCLLLTFITYCIFKSLRTLPGLNTMALIVHLFLAQLIFLVAIKPHSDNNTICQFLGILIHYLWLSTFAWMSVCACHMYLVFRDVFNARKYENKTRFYLYLLFGNLVPAFVPAICVLYHYFTQQHNMDDFGYGGWICFLNTPNNIAYFFAVPLGIVLLLNSILFTLTIIAIRRQIHTTASSNSTKYNNNHFWIYVKLSVLLGLTWILGLIAAASNYEPLWYAFTVINASQGLFIFLAYCCNKKIYTMYRDGGKGSSLQTLEQQSRTLSTSQGKEYSMKERMKE